MTNTERVQPLSETAQWLRGLGSLLGTAPELDLGDLPEEPSALFLRWLREANEAGVPEASRAEIESDLVNRPVTMDSSVDEWMLWRIRPTRVEFWQGAVSRKHTRLVYELDGGAWTHRVIGGEEGARR